MVDIDQLRRHQEQRLLPVIASWEEAKKQLKNAIAFTEAKEREVRNVSEDVKRKLEVLLLVNEMAREMGNEVPAENSVGAAEDGIRSMLRAAENSPKEEQPDMLDDAAASLLHRSSRPLFASFQKSA